MPHVLGNPNEAQIYTDSHWVAPFQQKISSTNMDVNTWLGWYNASVYASRQRYGHAKLYPQVISILHFRYPIAMNMHICVWKCPQTNTHTHESCMFMNAKNTKEVRMCGCACPRAHRRFMYGSEYDKIWILSNAHISERKIVRMSWYAHNTKHQAIYL